MEQCVTGRVGMERIMSDDFASVIPKARPSERYQLVLFASSQIQPSTDSLLRVVYYTARRSKVEKRAIVGLLSLGRSAGSNWGTISFLMSIMISVVYYIEDDSCSMNH